MCIRTSKVGALLLAIFVLAACAKPSVLEADVPRAAVVPRATAVLDESYVLGPGDELNIVVFNHADLSGTFVVGIAGNVSVPLIGDIRAAGRTTDAVRQDYSDLLANGYLLNPSVSIDISIFRPFFIRGAVNNPGAYPYQTGMDIRRAIALAGGHSKLWDRYTPPLLKRERGAPVGGETVSVYTPVFPGDVIEIPICRRMACKAVPMP